MNEPEEKDDFLEYTTDMSAPAPSSGTPASNGVVIMAPMQLSESNMPYSAASGEDDETDDILEMTQTDTEGPKEESALREQNDDVEATLPPSHFTANEVVPFARISAIPEHHDINLNVVHETTLEGIPVADAPASSDASMASPPPEGLTEEIDEEPELIPPPEEPDTADELFELDEQLVVEAGVERSSPVDAPVPHAFDFGTPEMVFDQTEGESIAPTEASVADSDAAVESAEAEPSAGGKYISFIPESDVAADIAAELDDDDIEVDDEPEVELDIGEAEVVLPSSDDGGPRPIDSFFKNDISAAEQAASGAFTTSPARRRRGAPQDWWASIFDDEYLMLLPAQSAYEQQKQMDFIQMNLGLPQGALLLDMACGNGTNAIGLAKRNYRLVGVDLSLSMLARAGEAAQEAGQKINFIHGDMRDLGFDKTFDGIICMDTSFGYFDEATNAKVLNSVYKALKPGGVLLLELANRDFVIKQQPNLIWFQMDNMVCMEETDFNYINSRLYITRQLIIGDNQKQTRHEFSLRLYSLHEIGQMMHTAGFAVTKVSGHRASPGAFFGPESSKLIIVAERRRD